MVERSEGISWVACASTAGTSPLNASLARQMLQALQQPALLNASSLSALCDAHGDLSLQSLRFHVDDIVYLQVQPTSILCSCPAAAVHAQCEHSTFLHSLRLPNFLSPPLMLGSVPESRKRTGRPKAAAAPPRKRRRAT